jgi:1-acyl-sn-glycerol-3-phosphate acyltransferase
VDLKTIFEKQILKKQCSLFDLLKGFIKREVLAIGLVGQLASYKKIKRMSSKKPIHQPSLGHKLLRSYVDIFLYSFYNRVTIVGKENVPKNAPVILAINHQNSLMDALTVLCTLRSQPVFMARADIFKKPVVAKILRFFKIIPIFRMRDGKENLQNNDASFDEAVGVLLDRKRLAILPEGNHFGHRRLRVLKKGIARIAFQAEERSGFELGIQIVPVGLDYSNYINFGADLLVHFGEPFPVNKYKEMYMDNPQKAMNAFMQELRERMLPQMLNIDDEKDYEELALLKDIYIKHLVYRKDLDTDHTNIRNNSQLIADKIIAFKEMEPEKFQKMADKGKEILTDLQKLDFRLWVPAKGRFLVLWSLMGTIFLFATFPLFLVGFVFNFLPFYIPVLFTKKIKDPQFVSSIRFGFSILTFTLFYITYLVVFLIFISPIYYSLGTFISVFILGLFSYEYYAIFAKNIARWRAYYFKKKENPTWIRLIQNWNELTSQIANIIQ